MKPSLAACARFELEIKRSRFVCRAAPVAEPADAMRFLSEVADPAATHNCWAYRIGDEYRSSDDGEPSGTAGRPILAAIDGQGLDAVVAVVSRWYGGIKLGAGGLVRAYGGCAAECLRLAERVERVRRTGALLRCAFEDLGSVHALLGMHRAEKLDEQFEAAGARLRVSVETPLFEALRAALREASRGRIELVAED